MVRIWSVFDSAEVDAVMSQGWAERQYLDRLITLQGSRERLQLAWLEQVIREQADAFHPVDKIRVESWQGISVVQSLARLGLPVELYTPTAKSHAEEWPMLRQALVARRLVLPAHTQLREELLNLTVEVTPMGVKVVDRGRVHQDHATVVRMLVARLMRPAITGPMVWGGGGPNPSEPVDVDERQREQDAWDAERHAAAVASMAETLKRNGGIYWPADPGAGGGRLGRDW
jgi:hypothetical protein